MARNTPKPVIARTSSMLAAAITRVGIPLSAPIPRFINDNIPGTTTAGDTAPRINLHNRECKIMN